MTLPATPGLHLNTAGKGFILAGDHAFLKRVSAHSGQRGTTLPWHEERTSQDGPTSRPTPISPSTGQDRRDTAEETPASASGGRKDWVRCLRESMKAPTRALFSTCNGKQLSGSSC